MYITEKMEKTSRVSQEWEVVQEICIQKLQEEENCPTKKKTKKTAQNTNHTDNPQTSSYLETTNSEKNYQVIGSLFLTSVPLRKQMLLLFISGNYNSWIFGVFFLLVKD